MLDQTRLLLFLGSTEWLLNSVGGGVGKEGTTACGLHNEKEEARYWSYMCLFWSTNRLYELTGDRLTYSTVCLCVYTFVCALDKEREEAEESHKSLSIWDISKATKHRGKHDFCLYWLLEHWLEGFVGLCWLINSLGTGLLQSDRCCKDEAQVRGVVPLAVGLHLLYDSQRFRVMLVTYMKQLFSKHLKVP